MRQQFVFKALVVTASAFLMVNIATLPSTALGHSHRPPASQFALTPSVFDPSGSGFASSTFVNMDGFTVLRLQLNGNVAYPPGIAAQATITGNHGVRVTQTFPPMTVSQLGFDITSDSLNQGGSPRFDLFDDQGSYWLMPTFLEAKQLGTVTPLNVAPGKPYTWSRVSCDPSVVSTLAGELSNGANPGRHFTSSTIVTRIDIIFDIVPAGGPNFANIANVTVNNSVVAPNMVPTHH